jgi:predicted AAA+ superfamily ATPase
MYRTLYNDLLEWKDSNDRKPLVLFGARQTGKTWLLKEFGTNEYSNVAYINCDNNPFLFIFTS